VPAPATCATARRERPERRSMANDAAWCARAEVKGWVEEGSGEPRDDSASRARFPAGRGVKASCRCPMPGARALGPPPAVGALEHSAPPLPAEPPPRLLCLFFALAASRAPAPLP
jgi:hypothetical protein